MDSLSQREISGHKPRRWVGPLGPEHASEIAALAELSFENAWNHSEFQFFLKNRCLYSLGARIDGVLVGFVFGLLVDGELDIASVAVDPKSRRLGIARELITQALSDQAIQTATLEVSVENGPAVGLYRALGFTIQGIRKNYYQAKTDALQMRKDATPC